jgi:hypothetical protein
MSETQTETRPLSPADDLLKNVRVASPCRVSWDEMPGGDRVRSCAHCRRKVYNLSEMSAADAASLLRDTEGRLCVRFYRRADGTVMTRDCPVGLRAVRVRLAKGISVAFASLMVACGFSLSNKPRSEYPVLLRLLMDKVAPEPPPQVMGKMQVLPMAPPTPAAPVTDPAGWRMGDVAGPAPEMGEAAIAPGSEPVDPTVSDSVTGAPDPTTQEGWEMGGIPVRPDPTVVPLLPDNKTPLREVGMPPNRPDPFASYEVVMGRVSNSAPTRR